MQTLILAGNVGRDAKLNHPQNGDAVLNFSIAVDNGKDRDGNSRAPTWYDCSLWGKRGEALEKHILKGTKLTVSGRPSVRVHEGKAYLGITIDQLTFMGSSGRSDEQGERRESKPQQSQGNMAPDDDSDIPF
jgi:single-strand DNA-binding protein